VIETFERREFNQPNFRENEFDIQPDIIINEGQNFREGESLGTG